MPQVGFLPVRCLPHPRSLPANLPILSEPWLVVPCRTQLVPAGHVLIGQLPPLPKQGPEGGKGFRSTEEEAVSTSRSLSPPAARSAQVEWGH